MAKLPRDLSGQQVAKALARIVVPDHHAVRVGTLRQILREAGLSVDDFLAQL